MKNSEEKHPPPFLLEIESVFSLTSIFTPIDSLVSLSLSPCRSVQTLADKSKQEALKNDLMVALKRKQQS